MSIPALSQMTLADQNLLLIKILEALVNPMAIEPGTARMRVSLEATVATLQMNVLVGYDAKLTLLNATELNLWANAMRPRIT